jgi:MSHA biogenesis protein MshO
VRFSCASGNSVVRVSGSSSFCGVTPTASNATLVSADSVECLFTYNPTSAANGLVSLRLTLTKSGESVTLFSQFHVDNVP